MTIAIIVWGGKEMVALIKEEVQAPADMKIAKLNAEAAKANAIAQVLRSQIHMI